ncbi:ricin-type beta-trefoil lectin domain protein [Streptomyces sp. NPDC051976]|uniref:ricin-type beta-trefoil lectin domain protein n=1 Tax=Streptomyces sp. NPDC051976 TaxID=3154947 RepID=UPI003433F816
MTVGATLLAPAAARPATGATAATPATGSTADWAAIQSFLPSLNPTWSAPPTSPTTKLEPDGPLLGNGDLTVSVGGDTHSESLYLSKNDFWTNSPGTDNVHPIALGGITLRRPASGIDSGTTYNQTEDLLNAEARSDLTINGAPIHTRSYTSDTNGDMLVTEVSTTGNSPVVLNLDTWTKADNASYPASSGVSGSTLWASRSTIQASGSQWVSRAAIATRVLGSTATVTTNSTGTSTAQFTVNPGQTVTVVSAVAGGKNDTTQVADAQHAVAGLDTTAVASLSAAHQAWWKAFWLKSYVRVFDTTVEKYYYGSQYIMGSASRSGSQAAPMFGWTTVDTPMWNSAYFLNYNHEAAYYGVFSSNRPELADPYIQSIVDYEGTGAANIATLAATPATSNQWISQNFKNTIPATTRGYLYPLGIGPWGSSTYWGFWNQPTAASYAAVDMIYRYEYSPDNAYLSGTLYPYIKQLAEFWQDHLGSKGSDGKYHLMGAAFEGDWTHDDSLDLATANQILQSAVKYSQILGVDSSMVPAWRDILNNLPAYATDTYNGQTVYTSDHDTSFATMLQNHQTICNLEMIHPFDQLNLDSPPAQLQAAINTLNAMNTWSQANNFPKSFGVAARVGYPAASLFSLLKSRIAATVQPNQTSTTDVGGLESAGATDAVNAMLLQSVNGTIRLFPDYPAGRAGHFSNLRVQGGFLVSADYDGTTVSNVSLTADNAGSPATVLSPWPGRAITVTDSTGNTVSTTANGNRYTFATTAGQSYTITPQGGATTGGSLTGSVGTQPAGPVDLTAQGTTDWAHWGLSDASSLDHKAGVTQAISKVAPLGAYPRQLTDSQVTYTWTAGTPTASATATPTGLYATSVGYGFQLTVPATTTPQRLRVYLGAWSAKGKLTASLSDSSTAVYTGSFDSPSGNGYGMADLTFRAASTGQTLTLTYVVDTSHSSAGDGNITLHAATLTPATGPITGTGSGKCVDIPGANNTDSSQLQLYTCNGTVAQQWTVAGDGTVLAMGKCMDVRQASTADGTPVQIYPCNGTAAQHWSYEPASGRLQALGKCLDANSSGTANSTPLVIDTCSGAASQRWTLS